MGRSLHRIALKTARPLGGGLPYFPFIPAISGSA